MVDHLVYCNWHPYHTQNADKTLICSSTDWSRDLGTMTGILARNASKRDESFCSEDKRFLDA